MSKVLHRRLGLREEWQFVDAKVKSPPSALGYRKVGMKLLKGEVVE